MEKLIPLTLSLPILKQWVNLNEYGIADYDWLDVAGISLSETEQQELQHLKSKLKTSRLHLMNEATIWARGIYPLLSLAEQGNIQAWASVTMYGLSVNSITISVLNQNICGED